MQKTDWSCLVILGAIAILIGCICVGASQLRNATWLSPGSGDPPRVQKPFPALNEIGQDNALRKFKRNNPDCIKPYCDKYGNCFCIMK